MDRRRITPEEIVQAVVKKSHGMTRPIYRGQANSDWKLEAGAIHRVRQAYGEDLSVNSLRKLVAQYHNEQLITPMQIIDGATLSDLQRLSALQHQGAATGLLDFTENLQVALWFACSEEPEKDAKVFLIDIEDSKFAINGRMLEKPFRDRQEVVYYEPDRSLGARVVAQQSVFILDTPALLDQHLKSKVVPQSSKKPVLDYLRQLGLSEKSLFGDIPGLATANARHKKLQPKAPATPKQHRHRGLQAYQEGRYDDALTAYEAYRAAFPDIAEPYVLEGNTLTALRRFEDAYLAYTAAIMKLDRAIYPDEELNVNPELQKPLMFRALYYNRGNVRAATFDHPSAIADFDAALQYGDGPTRRILANRGNSKFALKMFAEAHKDFQAAWFDRLDGEGSAAALAMGNCKVMMGEFEDALQQYRKGIDVEPAGSAAHCKANAEQVGWLSTILNGCPFRIIPDGAILFVETAQVQTRAPNFPFAGNMGNAGNMQVVVTGHVGEGYEGLEGFAVAIVPPKS